MLNGTAELSDVFTKVTFAGIAVAGLIFALKLTDTNELMGMPVDPVAGKVLETAMACAD